MKRGIGVFAAIVMACFCIGCNGRSASDAEGETINYYSVDEFMAMFVTSYISINDWEDYLELGEKEVQLTGRKGKATGETVLYKVITPKDGILIAENFNLRVNYTVDIHRYHSVNGDINQNIEGSAESSTLFKDEIIEVNTNDILTGGFLYPLKSIAADDSGYVLEEYEYTKSHVNNVRGIVYRYNIPDDAWNVYEDGNRFIAVRCIYQNDAVDMYFFESGYWTTSQHYKDLDFIIGKEQQLYDDKVGVGNWVYAFADIK